MGQRNRRGRRPSLEPIEARQLLSLYTVVMVGRHLQAQQPYLLHQSLLGNTGQSGGPVHTRGRNHSAASGFVPSGSSIAVPANQGPQPTNQAIFQTGNLSPREQKRQQFTARFVGPYTVGAGRTDTEAAQTFIRGAGTANTILHADIQLNIITPKDPATPFGSITGIFDRNLNSNTVLGFDASSSQQNVDQAGRPNRLDQLTIDVNESSGVYDQAFGQGVIDIKYVPSGKHTSGVLDQGTAVVTIHAQIYTIGTDYILRNADLNPPGGRALK